LWLLVLPAVWLLVRIQLQVAQLPELHLLCQPALLLHSTAAMPVDTALMLLDHIAGKLQPQQRMHSDQ
uniref:LysR family transcriptional regulator n=1 Tax=Brugia timori TaxID=42155 RepID=A0A0R3QBA1_9BILA